VHPRTWLGFAAMCLGMFMAILDIQIVASSLPAIEAAVGVAGQGISWIQTAYLIAEVVAIALTGFLGRAMSLRWLFVLAAGGFTLASAGCAASETFPVLVAWRVVQGFCGGALIPAVFAAVFLLFPPRLHERATMLAGLLAMLAPTLGPALGGWITQTWSWHWLFLVNLAPGVLVTAAVAAMPAPDRPQWRALRRLDLWALLLLVAFLGLLEVLLEEAPSWGWSAPRTLLLAAACAAALALAVRRLLGRAQPLVDLRAFADRNFAAASAFSFVLGVGLFGSVYMLPLFLGHVRGHGPLGIGEIMVVTGAAQLVGAPLAVWAERRCDPRLVMAVGYALFAAGLGLGGFATVEADFEGLFWPQVLRGLAVMLCLLPATRLALGQLPPHEVENASGLFNLLRNLGGACGLALVDTVLSIRVPHHAAALADRLLAGDATAAREVGLDPALLQGAATMGASALTMAQPLVEKAALTAAFNEAWWLAALCVALPLLLVPWLRRAA